MAEAEPRIWDDAPSVLIFANCARSVARASAVSRGIGARVIGAGDLATALPRLAHQVAIDAVVLELDQWSGVAPALLAWAEEAADSGFAVPVICFPPALLDAVAAYIASPIAELLCAPTPEERIAALAVALADRGHCLHDHGLEASAERLRRLSQEVARIATTLTEMSTAARMPVAGAAAIEEPADAPPIEPQTVRALIRLRRLRAQYFADHLFADPAWDMLLDLMAARLEEERVAVSSLCIAAAVPPTTALRWIRTMTEQGLFVRRHDPGDGRRIFIDLSDRAAAAMSAYLRQAQSLGWRPA